MLFKLACRQYRRTFGEFLGGDMSPETQAFLARHEAACPRCARKGAELRAIHAVLLAEGTMEVTPSPDFTDRVVERVRAARREAMRPSLRPVFYGAGAALVAVGAILQVVGAPVDATMPDGSASSEVRTTMPLDDNSSGDLKLFDSPSRLVRDPRPNDV